MKTLFVLLIAIYVTNTFAKQICLETSDKKSGNYLGCYQDHENQRMFRGFVVHMTSSNSIEQCVKTCHARRFVYAGAQNGYGCYCGNSAPKDEYHNKVSDKNCNKLCPGHSTEKCGGYGYMSVYETGIEQFLISGKGKRLEDSNIISDKKWFIA
ncbi:sialate:O-sulfotransferase 1-like [Culicoides brevitarsis]|uniref:sialate:O-sulfotransferase 1-like n=1 Tax=Culicoides brevitarsis TaxID=469753 RepID=UPI00307BFE11